MGSAIGRRKCCAGFWLKGYEAGYSGSGRWAGKNDGDPWEERELMHMAHTVSKSFAGLYRIGHEWGVRDRNNGKERPYGYEDYRCWKEKRNDVLNLLDQGYILTYAPDSGWPRHPFRISSPPGGIIFRRTVADLEAVQETYPHGSTIRAVLALYRKAQMEKSA